MTDSRLSSSMLVEEVLSRYPHVAEVFDKLNLPCVGCWLTDTHTIADVANIFDLDLEMLMRQLREAIGERAQGHARS
ncbi:MAG: hypothetical protein SNJ58_04095 [Aggregatilineales bacterium]